jgi:hypothetical protein
LTLWGVNGGVVHVVGSNLCHVCLFGGHQWWYNAWFWVRIFVFLGSMVV